LIANSSSSLEDEKELTTKVEQLMTSLDVVKKYKALAGGVVDFTVIVLLSVIGAVSVFIGQNLYQTYVSHNPNFIGFPSFLIAIAVFAAGLVAGLLWVDRKVRKAGKLGGEPWKDQLEKEGAAGAIGVLSNLDWAEVFEGIRYSKLGFVMYGIVKIIGYWILAFILLFFLDGIILDDFVHELVSLPIIGLVSLILVLILSMRDLQKRYNQSWALDSLLWELRWFESEFRRAEFVRPAEEGRSPK
jgi:hypothetical protein